MGRERPACRHPRRRDPAVGALFVNTTGTYGHVAYVETVNADGTFTISERNATGRGNSTAVTTRTMTPRQGIEFVYGGPASGAEYIGHIVQWSGDGKTQRTAWYVVSNGGHPQRNWIPDTATYWCLKRRGAPGPTALPGEVLSQQLPDQRGIRATCTDGTGGGANQPLPGPDDTTTSTPSPTPTPVATTFPETTGGVTHTWTNHTNAGGLGGPTIPRGATVQIACKLQGWRAPNGNTWWYRIAESPWDGRFYASADAFYNNGQTSGPLGGTPFVDAAVPNC